MRVCAGEEPRARVGAQLCQPGVDRVGRDFASLHIDDLVPEALFQETDGAVRRRGGLLGYQSHLLVGSDRWPGFRFCLAFVWDLEFGVWVFGRAAAARRGKVRCNLRTIAEGARRANDGGNRKFNAGHVAQQFGHLAPLPLQLFRVYQVLILATAAAAEERAARRRNPVRRRGQHREEVGLGVVLVVAEDPGADPLAGKRERDHDDPAGGPGRRKFQVTSSKRQGFREPDPTQPHAQVGERGDLQFQLLVVSKRTVVEFLSAHRTHRIHGSAKHEAIFHSCVSWVLW